MASAFSFNKQDGGGFELEASYDGLLSIKFSVPTTIAAAGVHEIDTGCKFGLRILTPKKIDPDLGKMYHLLFYNMYSAPWVADIKIKFPYNMELPLQNNGAVDWDAKDSIKLIVTTTNTSSESMTGLIGRCKVIGGFNIDKIY